MREIIGKISTIETEDYKKKVIRDYYGEKIYFYLIPSKDEKEYLKKLNQYTYYILYMEDEGIQQAYTEIGKNRLLLILQYKEGVYTFEEVDYQNEIEKEDILENAFQGYSREFIDKSWKELKRDYTDVKRQVVATALLIVGVVMILYLANLVFSEPEVEVPKNPVIPIKSQDDLLTEKEKYLAGLLVYPKMIEDIKNAILEAYKDKEHTFIWGIEYNDMDSPTSREKSFILKIYYAYDYPAKNTIRTQRPPYTREVKKSYVYTKRDIQFNADYFKSVYLSKECLDILLNTVDPIYVDIQSRNLYTGDVIVVADLAETEWSKEPLKASQVIALMDKLAEYRCPVYPVKFEIRPNKKILKFRILEDTGDVFIKQQ